MAAVGLPWNFYANAVFIHESIGRYIKEQHMHPTHTAGEEAAELGEGPKKRLWRGAHAAWKSIPLRNKLRNRANRHAQEAFLPSQLMTLDGDQAEAIESALPLICPASLRNSK